MIRRGMTLVEMLVAMAATLLMMGAVAQLFASFGTAVSDSRAVIEVDSQLRAVAWRLRSDLAGATAPTTPPLSPATDAGYFELIEGPNTDTQTYFDPATNTTYPPFDKTGTTAGPGQLSDDRILGDTDDVLLFTTRNIDQPFLGKFEGGKYESPIAEVAWFLRPMRVGGAASTANPGMYSLYRRQLLVIGYVGAGNFASANNMISNSDPTFPAGSGTMWQRFFSRYDISVRAAANGGNLTFLPNTLSDLTRRESRFMHNVPGVTNGSGFPYAFPRDFQVDPEPDGLTFSGTVRNGEDVVLSNVIGFDVRVFDPTAPVGVSGATVLSPGDPGFVAGIVSANGAYVDLGHSQTTRGPANRPVRSATFGQPRSGLTGSAALPRTWDTWSTHYETDGYDQDSNLVIDQGSNGLDDDSNGVVDDGATDLNGDGSLAQPGETGELETLPPYPFPLRGIEVRIRCYEPSSRQVRQVTVRHTFVPH